MKIPSWNTITVEQYQDVYSIITSDDPDEDKQTKILAVLCDMSETAVDELPLDEYNARCKKTAYLFTKDIPGKSKRYIKANGKRYLITHDVRKIRAGQYVEVLSYSGNYIDDLHKLMASIAYPVKGVFRNKVLANDSNNHEAVASDMLQARFIDVYHTAVFFYRVLRGSIKVMRGSLVEEMSQKMPRDTANQLMTALISDLDGFITPKELRGLRVSA